jgi:hypothetical protein
MKELKATQRLLILFYIILAALILSAFAHDFMLDQRILRSR